MLELCFIFQTNFTGQSFGSPIVTDLKPKRIGYGGGAVTINGEGFSEDVFNQFDPVLGNKVFKKPRIFLRFHSPISGLVCQRICVSFLPDSNKLELPVGKPTGPIHHEGRM